MSGTGSLSRCTAHNGQPGSTRTPDTRERVVNHTEENRSSGVAGCESCDSAENSLGTVPLYVSPLKSPRS